MLKFWYFLVIIALIAIVGDIRAQAPQIEWDCFYGEVNMNEYARGAHSTPDGGYVAGGNTQREGSLDCLIVKFNSEGDTVWTRSTGSMTHHETIQAFYVLPDGKYLSAGAINEYGDIKSHIMIMAPNGDHEFSGYYNSDHDNSVAFDVALNLDSGFVFVSAVENDGDDNNDVSLTRLHPLGAPQWEYSYDMAHEQIPYSVVPMMGGGYFVVGESQDFVNFRDQGMIYITNSCGVPEIITVHDSNGRVVYTDVQQLPDSGFVITGLITDDLFDTADLLVKRLNADLSEAWTKTYGFGGDDVAECVEPTADGGFIVGGTCEVGTLNYWALRLDANGDTLWTKITGTPRYDYLRSISITDDGGYIMCGESVEQDNPYRYDMYVVKLEPDQVGIDDTHSQLSSQLVLSQNYPNPFNASTTIEFRLLSKQHVNLGVYDILGREITTLLDETRKAGTHAVSFDAGSLPSGIYFYKILADNYTRTRRMLLIK
ncbi:MAG: T9SS type A sorting domain-containing protein [candidate division Zixibacteria bacterium]|nr:T9SS type A sorting domain-containing protein [candidate division Zixibacteria bacterium]